MAHQLSLDKNGKAEMAFVGQTPWHGLGQQVTKGASIGVWKKEAGFNWSAIEAAPLYHCVNDKPGVLRSIDGNKVLYRSDTGAPLSIVSEDYNIVQPNDVMEFFRDITETAGWHIHTAGVLLGGKKLWVMASRDERKALTAKDVVVNNLLVATSLDGSMRTMVKDTPVCVVCANTFAIALGGKGREIQISHRTAFDSNAIQRQLGLIDNLFETFMVKARELSETPINVDDAKTVLNKIFAYTQARPKLDLAWLNTANPAPLVIDNTPQEPRSVGKIMELFEGAGMGADLKGRKGTKWGLFNAVTQHVDHDMGRTDTTRLNSAWFGNGAGLKTHAWDLLATV